VLGQPATAVADIAYPSLASPQAHSSLLERNLEFAVLRNASRFHDALTFWVQALRGESPLDSTARHRPLSGSGAHDALLPPWGTFRAPSVDLCDNVLHERNRNERNRNMTTLTIRIDAKLERALERIAKRTGRSKSEIAREALKRQVALTRFRELRHKTLPFAEAQGLLTDEDVFRHIS